MLDRIGLATPPCGAPGPVLQISSLEHVADQPQQPAIVDLLAQDRQHDLMVKTAETVRDVTLDEPVCSRPGTNNLAQGGVAAPAGTETMGMVGELNVVVRVEQHAHHPGDQLVRPRRQTQRTLLACSLLLDVDASRRGPSVTLTAERVDDRSDFGQRSEEHTSE